jgi:predicted HicB family RNase H-like nuclease
MDEELKNKAKSTAALSGQSLQEWVVSIIRSAIQKGLAK